MSASAVQYKAFTSKRPFGVEMEVNEEVSRDIMGQAIRDVDPNREVQVTGWTMTGVAGYVPGEVWSVKTDSTCSSTPGLHGHEVASFKASGAADIRLMGDVAQALKDKGCKVNLKCGVHVHGDISDWNEERVGVMLAHWCKIEYVISQALPAHRRNNQYAKLMRRKHRLDYDKAWTGKDLYLAMEPTNLEVHHNREKRVAINLVGYATGRILDKKHGRKTAELRIVEGTLEREDIENWTRLYVHFLDECATKAMPGLNPVGIDDALTILGLRAPEGEFALLAPELWETKRWFLNRIKNHTNDPVLFNEAIERLNRMVEPFESYVVVEKKPKDDPSLDAAA